MDHGHHGHGDMDMGPMCSMNMLFTWDTTNLCIVFRSWRIAGFGSLILSLLAVVALSAGYEAIKEAARQYEVKTTPRQESTSRGAAGSKAQERQVQLVKALFYGVQVFYSFFIMLIFMTYNGWVMIAVGVGAFVGYLLFGASSPTKSAACH